jgi:hypothetical protein
LELYKVWAAALNNFDRDAKNYRFEINIEGGDAAHSTLWEVGSAMAPKSRTIRVHVRARNKHTIAVGM